MAGFIVSSGSAASVRASRPGGVRSPNSARGFAAFDASASGKSSADASIFAEGPGAATLVGNGSPGNSGIGGVAESAELDGPTGVAVDSKGDVFIADTGACEITEIPGTSSTQHSIDMKAGDAYEIAGGNCRSNSQTSIGFATSVAVDASGDVYVADPSDNDVLEIPAGSRRPVVVAGDGTAGYSGDRSEATSASLHSPDGIALDGYGDLYIADTANCVIREVSSHGQTQWGIAMTAGDIYTVAGTGTCGQTGDGGQALDSELWNPTDVAIGPTGNLVVADDGGEEIVDVPSVSGTYYGTAIAARHLAMVAGFGFYGAYLGDGFPSTGQVAELNSPTYITLDPAGNLFISDTYSSSIRIVPNADLTVNGVHMTTGNMYTLAGALPTGTGFEDTKWVDPEMLYPEGIALSENGRFYYADQGANVVRVLQVNVP